MNSCVPPSSRPFHPTVNESPRLTPMFQACFYNHCFSPRRRRVCTSPPPHASYTHFPLEKLVEFPPPPIPPIVEAHVPQVPPLARPRSVSPYPPPPPVRRRFLSSFLPSVPPPFLCADEQSELDLPLSVIYALRKLHQFVLFYIEGIVS